VEADEFIWRVVQIVGHDQWAVEEAIAICFEYAAAEISGQFVSVALEQQDMEGYTWGDFGSVFAIYPDKV
jgi:hypothetical protein